MNNDFERYVINYYGNLPNILKQLGNKPQTNGTMYCPMHDNTNTPAAKLYKDKDGYKFWCFNENKMYATYDIYKDIYHYNMKQVFNTLWSNLSEEDKKVMQDMFGERDENNDEINNEDLFIKFYNKEIDYNNLILEISKRIV